jgi:hypothetical protein
MTWRDWCGLPEEKAMTTIYVLTQGTGEYGDYQEKPVAWYSDRVQADARCESENAKTKEWEGRARVIRELAHATAQGSNVAYYAILKRLTAEVPEDELCEDYWQVYAVEGE